MRSRSGEKTLRNNVKGVFKDEQLLALGVEPGARAETLTLEQFVAIAGLLTKTGQRNPG